MAAVDGALYVRSARGPNGWYRNAVAAGTGRIRAGGVERDVAFADGADAPHAALDAAYARKYAHYPRQYVDAVVGEASYALTLRVDPA